MHLTLTIDTASATPDDFRRAASTLLHFGLGPDANASLTIDRVTIGGPATAVAPAAIAAADTAGALPDPATLGFGSNAGDAPPAPLPDPATVGFGSTVPSPGVGTAPVSDATVGGESVEAVLARVETDIDGLPWDNRIHASTKTKNKDGRWKKKKNVEPEKVTAVEAELRQIMKIPPPAPAAAATTTAAVPAPPAPAAAAAPPPPPPAATAPPAPPAAAAVAGTGMSFAALMGVVGPAMASGKLPGTKVEEVMRNLKVVDAAGVGQLGMLAVRPDLIPSAHDALIAAMTP